MTQGNKRATIFHLLVLAPLYLAACGPPLQGAGPVGASGEISWGSPTGTPFQPLPPTPSPSTAPTPELLSIWVSPALPDTLRNSLDGIGEVDGRTVEIVERPEAASVRVEPQADQPLTTWVYALGAAFNTIPDEVSLDQFWARWLQADPAGITAAPAEAAVLEAIFGPPGEGAVQLLPAEDQLRHAWEQPDSVTVLPFEALQPRWKVLSVQGESPIHSDFQADQYVLRMSFGLSGEAELIPEIAAALDWPESNRDADQLSVVVMTGVTALTRATAYMMDSLGVNYPGRLIRDWMREADIAHVSHEVAFAEDCPAPNPVERRLLFCSDPKDIGLFDYVGVDLIELTGNHVNDWGNGALSYTLGLYRERGFEYFGGGDDLERAFQPILIEHNGNRLAFLGCNYPGPPNAWATKDGPGATPCDFERLFAQLSDLRAQGYLPIFTFQWNELYSPYPFDDQRRRFREAVEAGAVIVSGSQAHQPQGMEFYQDGFIHYGLGNLFFDQMWTLAVRQEFLDRHVFYGGRYISTELLTAMLEDWAQPRPMISLERMEFLRDIFEASEW
jgi:hypothetical protein